MAIGKRRTGTKGKSHANSSFHLDNTVGALDRRLISCPKCGAKVKSDGYSLYCSLCNWQSYIEDFNKE